MVSNGTFQIGVDMGVKFTDAVAIRSGDGAVFSAKIPTSLSKPILTIDRVVRKVLELADSGPADVVALIHGTTAVNELLAGNFAARTALLVSKGFRHILEIARQGVPGGFGNSYFWVKPPRLIPLDRVYEIEGRIDYKGDEKVPIDEEQTRDIAYSLKTAGIESVAICLLHSCINSSHEIFIKKIFEEEHPKCILSLSFEVLPGAQEYERSVATTLDVAYKPLIQSCLDLEEGSFLGDLPKSTPISCMTSDGKVMSAEEAIARPLAVAMSGPAASVLACSWLAEPAKFDNIIMLDGGGLSTNVSILENGVPQLAVRSQMNNHIISSPMLDIFTVHIGGESLARIGKDKKIRLDPQNADPDPRSVSNEEGGEETTVTDALLFLGRLSENLAGGGMLLDRVNARMGVQKIAEAQGIPPVVAATQIIQMAVGEQVQAIRRLTVKEGKDPRKFDLMGVGGLGPLMAADIAVPLGIKRVILPLCAGCGSAAGLAAAAESSCTGPPKIKSGNGAEAARIGERDACLDNNNFLMIPLYDRNLLGEGDSIQGPAFIEAMDSTAMLPSNCHCEVDEWGSLRIHFPEVKNLSSITQQNEGTSVRLLVQEVIEGAINVAEKEMEDLVGNRSRSAMMRDLHNHHACLFDRQGKKLTGRSVSAVAEPVLKNWCVKDIHEDDVFLWNDPYQAEGGAVGLANLCVCGPVFYRQKLVAFCCVVSHLDDVGGIETGEFKGDSFEIFQEGLLVPPIKFFDRGVINEEAKRIICRNSRFPDVLQADIDALITACNAGSKRVRALCEEFGKESVLETFSVLLGRCEKAVRAELLPKIPEGEFEWEDYIEGDGVSPKKAHTVKAKMIKEEGKLTIDFRGTSPQAKGPINWPGNYAGGQYLKNRIGVILRSLADSYQRMFEIEINDGICPLVDIIFPERGSLITPEFPAPTNMHAITVARLMSLFCGILGLATKGRLPADQESARHWGIRGRGPKGNFLFREILGGGSGGRPWADGEDVIHSVPNCLNLSAEFSESRFPLWVEKVGLSPDSGGPGKRRGGLGYIKEIRVLCDSEIFSQGDRSIISPWGINEGKAGGLFGIFINPESQNERIVPPLSNGTKVLEGDLVRVITTGGGGWGNPFARELQYVRRDVNWGKVTFDGAMRHYGVVFSDEKNFKMDVNGSKALRQMMSRKGPPPSFFDRGTQFSKLKSFGVRAGTPGN